MEIQGASSAVMCKAFSLTLSGTAKDWYRNLPMGSISNFEELAVAFVDNFKSQQVRRRPVENLLAVKQRPDEGLLEQILQRGGPGGPI